MSAREAVAVDDVVRRALSVPGVRSATVRRPLLRRSRDALVRLRLDPGTDAREVAGAVAGGRS